MSTQTLTICRGLPASGKSAWALDVVRKSGGKIVRVNRDTIRLMLGSKFDPKNEDLVTLLRDQAITTALDRGLSVINDDTNLVQTRVEQLSRLASSRGIEVEINASFLDVSVEECIKRDAAREVSVGKDVIERMYFDFWRHRSKPSNTGSRTAILCDLDGTLALLPAGANPYSRDFTKDILNTAVAATVLAQRAMGVDLILLSGREEKARAQTIEWLSMNNIPYDKLLMRPSGDYGKDTRIKKELYMTAVQGKWRVLFVLDDRPSVVRLWRAELGLTCFAVAPGMEF